MIVDMVLGNNNLNSASGCIILIVQCLMIELQDNVLHQNVFTHE